MYPVRRHDALERLARGDSLSQVSRELGVSRAALRDWRTRPRRNHLAECPRCGDATLASGAYVALLGYYLGDGCLGEAPRYVALRVTCDAAWPATIEDVVDVVDRPSREARVSGAGTRLRGGSVALEALAVPVPPARPGPQARTTDRPRGLAAATRRGASRGVPARPLPLRRLSRAQLGDADGRRGAQAVRLPAVAVSEPPARACEGWDQAKEIEEGSAHLGAERRGVRPVSKSKYRSECRRRPLRAAGRPARPR